MFGIEKKVTRTAKRAGLYTGGLLLCSVGVAFMTAAAWIALATALDAQIAAIVIGCAYLGVGLVIFGVAASSPSQEQPKAPHAEQPKAPSDAPPIVQAFMYGLQAGAEANQTRH